MENKKLDGKSFEELVKAANSFRDFMAYLADKLGKALADIKATKEDTWEMKCPYREGDRFYFVNNDGSVGSGSWSDWVFKTDCFNQGNVFPTKQEAELEIKRRNLLTRFRAFRNECNDGWKPDWMDYLENKFLVCIVGSELEVDSVYAANDFVLFGYFKNPKDVERAIELFGVEIKELFVDCEGE